MIPSRLIPLDPWDPDCDTIINPAEIVSIQIDERPQMVLGSKCFAGPRSLEIWEEWYARRSEDNEAKVKFARVSFRNHGGTYWVALSEKETLKSLHMYFVDPLWEPNRLERKNHASLCSPTRLNWCRYIRSDYRRTSP